MGLDYVYRELGNVTNYLRDMKSTNRKIKVNINHIYSPGLYQFDQVLH